MIILRHKCAGVLAYAEKEEVESLLECQCISGWVHWALLGLMALSAALALTFVAKCAKAWIDGRGGFEPMLTREQAIERQIAQQDQRIALYRQQGRASGEVARVEEKKEKLQKLVR